MDIEELHKKLKEKEMQMSFLLHITQAINTNEPAEQLFKMYVEYMEYDLDIEKMLFFVKHEGNWVNVSSSGSTGNHPIIMDDELIRAYQYMQEIEYDAGIFQGYNLIVPVWHKDHPIALAVIKHHDFDQTRKEFIMTITNVIGVAIENKRLFNRQIEQERYRKEIELASEVQNMLIPGKLPRTDHLEVASIYKPQLNVGGDYYDFIQLKNGNYIFCVADISGKGVGAALLMSNFQATLHAALENYTDLKTLIIKLNRLLVKITMSERIITLFIADYRPDTSEIYYVNAGHTTPFMVMNNQCIRLSEGCTLLGAFDEIEQIEVGHKKIKDHALLMAYTDGLTDLLNDEGTYFDEAYIEKFLFAHGTETAENLNKKLLEQLDTFKGSQDYPDDIAILTCKIMENLAIKNA